MRRRNLHPLILFDANDPDSSSATEHFAGEVLEKCIEVAAPSPASRRGRGEDHQMCGAVARAEIERFRG